jgi:hypothetical protein
LPNPRKKEIFTENKNFLSLAKYQHEKGMRENIVILVLMRGCRKRWTLEKW